MASAIEVKTYLAHWFQLGKAVKSDDGRTRYQTQPVIQGDHFSPDFEACWTAILSAKGEALYLEGTDQTIAELLSPKWDVANCARCEMPVPQPQTEIQPHPCPCNDLTIWPNEELPRPRMPVNSQQWLEKLKDRLSTHLS